jgi:hypothetical protein
MLNIDVDCECAVDDWRPGDHHEMSCPNFKTSSNNCVFDAYERHLDWLEEVPVGTIVDEVGFQIYLTMKRLLGGQHEMFPAGCVPHLMTMIVHRMGYDFAVEYLPPFDRAFYLAHATSEMEKSISGLGVFHYDDIADAPGIYLPLHNKHAYFSLTRPEEPVIMSIKIYKES